ncbi:hypothetical protein ACFPOA_09395 [Lysobacter niabensis]|uniref:hypothetical protein n=1 Tax=Agrilutibacter niabensis TaxID=380628 RepID=UPI003621470D
MRTAAKIAALIGGLIALASMPSARSGGLVEPEFDLADFTTPLLIDNPYWPLLPGGRVIYFEESDDECIVNEVLVTSRAKNDFHGIYAGLAARVVLDREWLDEDCDGGRDVLLESTFDWHAQDDDGNIWYLGEDTTEFLYDDDGQFLGTSTEGSWQAGEDGAVAGLIILAEPSPGAFYQQEFYEDVAEDAAKIIGIDREVTTGLGTFEGCIITKEWSPLSPGSIEQKHYCPDFGLVLIEQMGGKTTVVEAVDIDLP